MQVMSMKRVAVWLAAAGVMVLGLATGWAASDSTLPGAPSTSVVMADVAAGWSFAIVGAALWTRYRSKLIGGLSIAVGLGIFLPDIRWFESSVSWTLGSMLTDVHLVLLAWLVLTFADGCLDRVERGYVASLSVYFVGLAVVGHLFDDPIPGCQECPASFMLIRPDTELNDLIWGAGQVVNLIVIGVLIALIIRKRNSSSQVARRALSPVIWALWPIGMALVLAFLEPLVGFGESGAQAVLMIERLALIAFPAALVVGIVRSRLDQARVGDLALALEDAITSTELEARIGEAIGDPTARLVFSSERGEGLIDTRGRTIHVGANRSQAVIRASDGTDIGAVVYDPAVDETLAASVSAAATLAVRNESLRAELRRHLLEVERSRERIAEAAMDERRRIERDLHDGAQQSLLALGARLGSIRSKADGEMGRLLDEAIEALRSTVDSLRDLARGVHPPILTDRGLAPAIETLAEHSPVAVHVDVEPDRFRPAVEAAAYFLVAEALTNAARHAEATSVRIAAFCMDDWLHVEVSDDGNGGADMDGGTGLQGLQDRVEAIGGQMLVSSPLGEGTTLRARLPCE
jgi:signal transduction histidine kinase